MLAAIPGSLSAKIPNDSRDSIRKQQKLIKILFKP
jgi:hypothetical protein